MAFTSIVVAPGLDSATRRRARQSGPRAVGTTSDTRRLLRSAGFVDVDVLDVTEAFLTTASAWIAENERRAEAMAARETPEAFEQRQRERAVQRGAVREGLLRRELVSARR